MPSLSRNAVLILIGLTLVLHTAEEYLTFPGDSLPVGHFSGWLAPPRLQHNLREFHIALELATVLPLLLIAWAIARPRKALLVSVLFLESILLVNVGAHLLDAFARRGYSPGLITAVLINLPFGIYVLRIAVKQQWIRVNEMWQLIGVAVVLHVVWAAISL